MIFHYCFSVTAPLDIVGVWTVEGRREQEPGLHLVQHLKTVINQVRRRTLLMESHWFHLASFNEEKFTSQTLMFYLFLHSISNF